jgi:ABC-type polysaccharide/polyol phosphate transport system ATPase subunit
LPLIDLDRVSMIFKVREQHQITFKEYVLKGMFRRSANPVLEIRALQEVSLSFRDGDRVGIIGGNGAGKSTMLRLLAGIYAPTRGRRRVRGRVSSLFELGLGFEMEATGRKNIAYRGYLQGETPRSLRAKVKEIAEFSELGRFLDIPVRFYSAGMMVRLAFSIATTIQPEILLVDEVLSAGDMAFQAKARRRMRDMLSRAKILVAVSHDMGTLDQVCEKGVWLDRGRVRMTGPMTAVIKAYEKHARQRGPESPGLFDGPSEGQGGGPESGGLRVGFPQLEPCAASEER